MIAAILSASLTSFVSSHVMASDTTQSNLEEARGLVQQFGGQLKPELQKAMKSGGPVVAVEFCHSKAPAIAKALAEKSGWDVNRVSLKARGAMAKPDAWETQVLNSFNERKAAGEKMVRSIFQK